MFNNREIAAGIFIGLIVFFALLAPSIRSSALALLRTALATKLTVSALIGIIWLSSLVAGLGQIGIWNVSHLKDTILWFASSGLILIFHGIRSKDPNRAFRELVSYQFKLLIFFEFIVNTYTFSLAWELILMIGLFFIGAMSAVAKMNPNHASVIKFLEYIQVSIVALIVSFTIYALSKNPDPIFSQSGLVDFCLPVLFTLWLLPWGYLLTVYAAYEQIFVRFGIHKQPASITRYIKYKTIITCFLNASSIRRASSLMPIEMMYAQTKNDVDENIKILRKRLISGDERLL